MSSNGTLQGFFYHLFSNIYATLFFAVFFGNFSKAHKNIPVFENDSRQKFKIIFQPLFNLCRHTRWT